MGKDIEERNCDLTENMRNIYFIWQLWIATYRCFRYDINAAHSADRPCAWLGCSGQWQI